MNAAGQGALAETMGALVLHAIGDLRYERVPMPTFQAGQALVRVAAVGVCGSDLPRVYEHGTYRMPLIPGHEAAGVVVAVIEPAVEAPGDAPVPPGTPVAIKPLIPCRRCAYCQIGAYGQCVAYDYIGSRRDGAWAEFVAVPQENLVPLPPGVALDEAALAEPLAVALHAVRQGGVQPGDCVAVLGAGPIGMLVAQWARLWGAGRVLLVDLDPAKLALVEELALGQTFNARQGDPVAWVLGETDGMGADLVVEAAGAPATLEQALRIARPLGRVVIMGNPAGAVTLPEATVSGILRKELTIRGTWNSQFTRLPVDEWQVALEMLAAGRIRVAPLITHRVPLAEGPAILERMRRRDTFYGRVLLVNS
ncbi:MAG: galactitol-1-phosphate 5-dehydrogenase [Chloroflexota bacterium]